MEGNYAASFRAEPRNRRSLGGRSYPVGVSHTFISRWWPQGMTDCFVAEPLFRSLATYWNLTLGTPARVHSPSRS
jgi:hypothetical protein